MAGNDMPDDKGLLEVGGLKPPAAMGALANAGDLRGGRPSASGLERLCLCPGSWLAEAACPEVDRESADAAAGSRLHRCMEVGSLPEDASEAEAVEWCRATELELAQEVLGVEAAAVRERRLWAQDRSFSGQPDAVFLAGEAALVVDYKFGRGEVAAAAGNMQLAALAVLAGQAFPQVAEVYAAILQPFVSRGRPQVVRYGRVDLAAAEAYLAKAIGAAQAPGAPLRPGVKQCKYCRAQAVCPAALREALSCRAVERWEALPLAARAELWRRAQLARRVADAIERRAKADLRAGVSLPGLELAPGRSSFTVTDAQAAYGILSEQLGVTAEEFAACCKVGVTALDKLVHAKRKAADAAARVKESSAWLRAALAGCAECKSTEGSVRERKGAAVA